MNKRGEIMYLVIDVGATYTKYGYFQKDGTKIKDGKIPTVKTNKEDFYQSLLQLKQPQLNGIALSMPGLIDSHHGIIHAITLLPFLKNTNVQNELSHLFQLPVTLENDAKCATYGEMWKGNLQNIQNGLFMVFGSGIGGTLIIDGKIIKGPRYKAGEIGSILMPLDNQYHTITNFGKNNNANIIIKKLSQIMNCDNDGITVFNKLSQHPEAYQFFQTYCKEIALIIYNLDYILDLDVVCIGGGISEQPLFIKTIQEQFQDLRTRYQEDNHQPIITTCQHFNEANLLGALYYHLQKKCQTK